MGASCLSWTLGAAAGGAVLSRGKLRPCRTGWSDPAGEPRQRLGRIAQELTRAADSTGLPGPNVSRWALVFGGYVNLALRTVIAMRSLACAGGFSSPCRMGESTPEQLRMIEVGLRYAWIAAWLARLVLSALPCATGAGFTQAGMGGGKAFGVGMAVAYNGLQRGSQVCPHRSSNCARVVDRSRRIS